MNDSDKLGSSVQIGVCLAGTAVQADCEWCLPVIDVRNDSDVTNVLTRLQLSISHSSYTVMKI